MTSDVRMINPPDCREMEPISCNAFEELEEDEIHKGANDSQCTDREHDHEPTPE